MITPNKVITLKESALGRASLILDQGPNATPISALYNRIGQKFDSIDQFLLTLDLLFVLGRINVDRESRMIIYVD